MEVKGEQQHRADVSKGTERKAEEPHIKCKRTRYDLVVVAVVSGQITGDLASGGHRFGRVRLGRASRACAQMTEAVCAADLVWAFQVRAT